MNIETNDISTDRNLEAQDHLQQYDQLMTLINNMPDFVNFKDGEGRWIEANDFAIKLYQLEGVPYKGRKDSELAEYSEFYRESLIYCEESDEQAWKAGHTTRLEETLPLPDGTTQVFDVIKVPMFFSDGGRKGLIIIGRDITERKQTEERMRYIAYHDPLTDLPNRVLFNEQVTIARELATRNNTMLAVMVLDLDRFKLVNDTLGHQIGDRLLKVIAKRLTDCTTEEQTVGRMGGDEFTILIPNVSDVNDVVKVATNILNETEYPLMFAGQEFHITPSIGIALYPEDGEDCESLLKHADTAMYRAKEIGKNNFQFYTSAMDDVTRERIAMESGLRKALKNNELFLRFQPKVNLETGQIIGMEALLRWYHPELGEISPCQFIPVAEETGLIVPIGEWVLCTASRITKLLQNTGYPDLRVAVNFSARQFEQKDLSDTILRILSETGLEPRWLEVEITESILMENPGQKAATLHSLKNMGIHISIDDFGTGYSSLSYLKKFPIDSLKIDQSFISEISTNSDNATIVQAIIALAHSLKLQVVAEGVETVDQMAFLKHQHCDMLQGYLISPPVSAQEFEVLLFNERYKTGS